jgi:hypothetical protein
MFASMLHAGSLSPAMEDFFVRAAAPEIRGKRVAILLVAITLLSLGDLYLTLTYATSMGMYESNPLARFIMSFGSPALVATWKIGSLLLACTIFYWARRSRYAEMGVWACTLLLAWLTCHWGAYMDQVHEIDQNIALVEARHIDGTWVTMRN